MHFAGKCTAEAAWHALLLLIGCNGGSAESKRLDRRLQPKTGKMVAEQPSGGTRRRSLCQRLCWHQSAPTACCPRLGVAQETRLATTHSCTSFSQHFTFASLKRCCTRSAPTTAGRSSQPALQCRAKLGDCSQLWHKDMSGGYRTELWQHQILQEIAIIIDIAPI